MESRHLKIFARLALATTLATYLLILVGGLVRASGAGLGCPDWPHCYGRWIPPTSVSQLPPGYDPANFNAVLTWTEYVNRLLGVTIGFLIIATFVTALRWHRSHPRILWPSALALLLVGYQGWLGGQVVKSGLEPWIISAHLVLALVIVTLLLYATFVAFELRGGGIAVPSNAGRTLMRFSALVGFVVLAQVYLGTLVRGGIEKAVGADPELARSAWLSSVTTQDQIHRTMAAIAVFAVGALMLHVRTRFSGSVALVRWATVAFCLILVQAFVGTLLARLDLPPAAQVIHLSVASLLLGSLVVVALLARRQ
jgi:cytochrome c oxidase assembly protein subunit 15